MIQVLLIEDDPLMYDLYRLFLTTKGYGVVVATDGETGLAKAGEISPDIILLDMMMPKMDGLEVLVNLKAQPKLKKIPVIMMTNLADQKVAEEAIKKGAYTYVLKSDYQSKKLSDLIQSVLKGELIEGNVAG